MTTSMANCVARVCRRVTLRFPPRQALSFGVIGFVCTLLFLLVYDVTRTWLSPLLANGLALTSTAALNFVANRHFTFGNPPGRLMEQALQYFVFYALGLGASSLALYAFLVSWTGPPRSIELVMALSASGLATGIRYVAMTLWVFPEPPMSADHRPALLMRIANVKAGDHA